MCLICGEGMGYFDDGSPCWGCNFRYCPDCQKPVFDKGLTTNATFRIPEGKNYRRLILMREEGEKPMKNKNDPSFIKKCPNRLGWMVTILLIQRES